MENGANPNAYDDEAYLAAQLKVGRAASSLMEAVAALWQAGGTPENIEDELQGAFENAVSEQEQLGITFGVNVTQKEEQ